MVDEKINENKASEEMKVEETKKEGKEAKKKPKVELEELKAENATLQEASLRQMAEFDNYKKRTQKEKEDISLYAKALCVKNILGVLDNFERAFETECSDVEYKKGIEMIFNQLKATLDELGVTEIEAQGKPFNPELHNAVNQVEDENFGENTVCQVLQKGYCVNGKVIRHSMVVVANP